MSSTTDAPFITHTFIIELYSSMIWSAGWRRNWEKYLPVQ